MSLKPGNYVLKLAAQGTNLPEVICYDVFPENSEKRVCGVVVKMRSSTSRVFDDVTHTIQHYETIERLMEVIE